MSAGGLAVRISRRFAGGAEVSAAFEAELGGGKVAVLFGPSGSGKSTVLRAIAGLDLAVEGQVSFAGERWLDSSRGVRVPPERRGAGLVFQDGALFPHLSVADNLAYGLFRLTLHQRADRLVEVTRLAGLQGLLFRKPRELSGGERQRVALARALAPRPKLLLLDEPFASLDAPARGALRTALRALLRATGTPALLVTHDRDEALALGDWLVVLAEGRVRQCGRVAEVLAGPADAAVARAVGTENVLSARVVRAEAGLVTLRVGAAELVAVFEGEPPLEVLACFSAEDVVLEASEDARTSARNRLAGVVSALERRGPLVRVTLDCGFPLVALVTRLSAEELALAPGSPAVALVKAQAVRLVAQA